MYIQIISEKVYFGDFKRSRQWKNLSMLNQKWSKSMFLSFLGTFDDSSSGNVSLNGVDETESMWRW